MRILSVYHGKIQGRIHWRMHERITACGIGMDKNVTPNYGPITCQECWSQLRTVFGNQVEFHIRATYQNGMQVTMAKLTPHLGPYKTLDDAEEGVKLLRKMTRAWKSELAMPSRPEFEIYVDLSGIAEHDIIRMANAGLFWSPELTF